MLLFWLGVVAILLFGGVILFGAPYLPTLKKQTIVALDLLDLQPGETLLELGCGDGSVLILAAKRGLKAVGFELNPLLALTARLRTWRYRHDVRVVWGNFWRVEWPDHAAGIFVFLHPRFMRRLDDRARKTYPGGIGLASFAFRIPGRTASVHRDGVYLYHYEKVVEK